MTWNRQDAAELSGEGALRWAVAAMRQMTDRLLVARAFGPAQAFAMVGEAVWWVTMVDATLIRYYPDRYGLQLASYDEAGRRAIEDTFGGLRFVRNQIGYEADHRVFIRQPIDPAVVSDRLAEWTWRQVAEPAMTGLPRRSRDWEIARHRAYQAQLADRAVGWTFSQAAAFLRLTSAASVAA